MRGGSGIGSHFLLMVGDGVDVSAKEGAQQLVASHSEVVELRTVSCHGITLVRPDGYTAYSAHGRNALGTLTEMKSLLERQTTSKHEIRTA
jgi:hypothetical protein